MNKEELEGLIKLGLIFNKRHNPYKFELFFYLPFDLQIPLAQILRTKRKDIDLDKKTLRTNKKEYKLTDKIVDLLKNYFNEEKEEENFLNTSKKQISWTLRKVGKKKGLKIVYSNLLERDDV
jgi:integrase